MKLKLYYFLITCCRGRDGRQICRANPASHFRSGSTLSLAMNKTDCLLNFDGQRICYQSNDVPFYHTDRVDIFTGLPDTILALVAPVLAYWSLSLFFHILDMSEWKWLDKYRIHESAEVQSRNLATRSQVVWAVIIQQAIQTMLGYVWVDEKPLVTPAMRRQQIDSVGVWVVKAVQTILGGEMGSTLLQEKGTDLVYFVYWWGIPIAQFVTAMCVYQYRFIYVLTDSIIFSRFIIDTWQYFLHRLMHVNTFLYKQFHSVHHRLYVPYAFGSLYNHPVEGFLLDSLGAVLGESGSFMTVRQATLFFTFSTFKTVDDHCGYSLPFDPLQWFTSNNADYHDIHHQVRVL